MSPLPDPTQSPACRVLVVEDDQTILANLVEYLEARGLGVDVAHDGARYGKRWRGVPARWARRCSPLPARCCSLTRT